jgi:intracellular multiplication protein IcmE
MGDRINNIGKMMNNPKQRNIYLLGVGVIVITLGVGFFVAYKNKSQQIQSSTQLETVPGNIKAVPGSSNNPDYVQSVKNTNEKQAAQAIQNGNSYIPTITATTVNNVSALDEIAKRQQQESEEKAKKEAEKKKAEEEERLRIEEESKKQQALINSQKSSVVTPINVVQTMSQVPAEPSVKKKYTEDDYMLIASLTSNWTNKKSSAEFDFARQKINTPSNNINSTSSNDNVINSNSTNTTNTVITPIAKAGTIFNAVIETAVNSDEDSPVLARIVSGPLKGTRLIGSFRNLGEKVAIVFSTANIPSFDKTVKINAYAIDTNTSRTSIADDVDHHYFLKYGVLLATSFISGYAQALQQSGATTTISLIGNTTNYPTYSASQLNKVALGQVSQQISNDIKQEYNNLKPTIYVNSGTAIGILLMEDLIIK